MSDYLRQLALALEAVSIRSLRAYGWFGEPSPRLPQSIVRQLTPRMARDYLLATLQRQLYVDLYCAGVPRSAHRNGLPPRQQRAEAFLEALSAANTGVGFWQAGWTVVALDGDEVVASRDGLKVWAPRPACAVSGGGEPVSGSPLSLYFPRESRSLSPGFYMAFGDVELAPRTGQEIVRIYWHLTPQPAVELIRKTSFLLNRARLPFNLKVVNDPVSFNRCDAGVLYIRKSDYTQAAPILAGIYGALQDRLKPGVPAFTKQLAGGLGLAENPGAGDSFGQQRCYLLADGMIRAYEQGETSLEGRLRIVIARFAEAGVDPERPYLNPGSSDLYPFHAVPRRHSPASSPSAPVPEGSAPGDFLQVAARIAQRLVHEAYWDEDRCTWLGPDPRRPQPGQNILPTTYRPLGPDLYAGTAGMALFLGEFYRVTGDHHARRTACGALQHALAGAESLPPMVRTGLFTGWTGIALAAVRTGAVLGEEELGRRGVELLYRLGREREDPREFDLLSGDAGAVAGLVAVHRILGDGALLDLARDLGDGLLRSAQRVDHTYAWHSPAFPDQRPLTGFSHGVAGVGYALLELYRRTNEPGYRNGAELAFNYERACFNPRAGNWPDFRDLDRAGRRDQRSRHFMTAWCHGAPGIALSRLRAYQLLGDATCRDEANIALETTQSAVEAALHDHAGDFSLCHGLAGLAEVLLLGDRILGRGTAAPIVAGAAQTGIADYASTGQPWPCGVGAGESPGLMLGLAGIGYFYLRLHDPTVPSLLLPDGAEFASHMGPAQAGRGDPVRADTPASPVVAAAGELDDRRIAGMVRAALRTHGFDVPAGELAQAARARWGTGSWLRDRVLPDRFPAFADPLDYLAVAETDLHLWNSLPLMLAFGYQQASVLQGLARVPAGMSDEVMSLCAVFSTLLSVFDYLVDESSEKATVFEIEKQVLPRLFDADGQVQRLLAGAYERAADVRVRLLCILFAMVEAGFGDLYRQSRNRAAWAELAEVMGRLFGAERKVTLTPVGSQGEMASLVPASEAKSVLPFVTLLRILTLAGPEPEPSSHARRAAETLGQAIALADDLMDLWTDYGRAAPSPLVLRLDLLAAQRGGVVTDTDLQQVVGAGADQLVALLQPAAFGLEDAGEVALPPEAKVARASEGAFSRNDLRAVLNYARLTVARWVRWQDDGASDGSHRDVAATADKQRGDD